MKARSHIAREVNPLKVAMFSRFPRDPDHPRGGIETVTVTLAQSLTKMPDIDLHIITLERALVKAEISQIGKLTIHRLPGSRCPQMLDILFGPGHWRLRQYLRQLEPDIVHCHECHGLCLGALPMPHVFTLHGLDHANIPAEGGRLQWFRIPMWRRIESWGLAHQKHIISITPYVRKSIAPITKAKIHDIDNPIAKEYFEIPRKSIPGRVFSSGWISPRKNMLSVVRVFAKVVRKGICASLHIAGEESDVAYARRLREEIRELGISRQTVLLGRISQSEIRRQLAEASVFILPSLQENAPMSIAEAMASALPVISSNRCGMPYMIEDGKTGYLVEPNDVERMAENLVGLLSNEDLRREMGALARHVATSRFHLDSVAQKTVNVYREILDEAHSARRA